MTAPDPRLDEIQARLDKTPPDHGHTQSWLPAADVRYLLAELRKAHEALERVEALAQRAESHGNLYVFVDDITAAVAAAKGDEQ